MALSPDPSTSVATGFMDQFVATIQRIRYPFSRAALFVVYFWFGILKLFDASPANPLVASLLERTLPFLTFEQFIIALGIFEMVLGIVFLIPGRERLALLLLVPHMIATTMPLILLPAIAWNGWLVPTLEGQYIIKNLLIIALAFVLVGQGQRSPVTWSER